MERVENIILNEAIEWNRVVYYLALVIRSNVAGDERTRLVPLFQVKMIMTALSCSQYLNSN